MTPPEEIIPFHEDYAEPVRRLFREENERLQSEHPKYDFTSYIQLSLREEFAALETYYSERGGGFWVAVREGRLIGMYGLERRARQIFELRRMYVAPAERGSGLARRLLDHAEASTRRLGGAILHLETSALQPRALRFYEKSGYARIGEIRAETQTNKTVGAGILRRQLQRRVTTA